MLPSLFFRDTADKAHRLPPQVMTFAERSYCFLLGRRELSGVDQVVNDLDTTSIACEVGGGSLGQGDYREGRAHGLAFQPPGQSVLKHVQPRMRRVDRETRTVHRQDQRTS
ncbi:hypothetical protein D3C85_1669530 [compost metagenome]